MSITEKIFPDIITVQTIVGYVKIKYSPTLNVKEIIKLMVQKISSASCPSKFGLEVRDKSNPNESRHFLCPHMKWAEVLNTFANHVIILTIREFPTKFEELIRSDRTALQYLYDQVIFQYKTVWEENKDYQTCFEIGCLEIKSCMSVEEMEHAAESIEKLPKLSPFFPKFILDLQKEKSLKRSIINQLLNYQFYSVEDCIQEILNRLLILIQFDTDNYAGYLGAGIGIPVRLLLGPRSQLRVSIGNTKEIRLLAYFSTIDQILVTELAHVNNSKRYQLKVILSTDPSACQPIIFTFDSKLAADTVAHTLTKYCKLSTAHSSQSTKSLLSLGCPFRPKPDPSVLKPYKSTIIRSHITLDRVLGEGQFGDVYKGLYKPMEQDSINILVAVKACKTGLDFKDKQRCLEEASLHGKLNHPHIIRFYGVCKDEPVWLVLEYAHHGQLRHYLIARQNQIVTSLLVTYCHQLSSALAFLEGLKIIHRDVAARNVLVINEDCVKLADFGMARELKELDVYIAEQGHKVPIKWMAPESLQSRNFSSASDVWMFGVCMWEVLSFGLKPFANISNSEAVSKISKGQRLPRPSVCSINLYHMLLQCWMEDPVLRPTFASLQLKIHEILAEIKQESSGNLNDIDDTSSIDLPRKNYSADECSKIYAKSRQISDMADHDVSEIHLSRFADYEGPIYQAVRVVIESIIAIMQSTVMQTPKQLFNAIQNVGNKIRLLYLRIEDVASAIPDITAIINSERQLNQSFSFLIEDIYHIKQSISNKEQYEDSYRCFLNQAYFVASDVRVIYQSFKLCFICQN